MTKFRYDINALRAIAVVSVLLFHLKISFFSGGFIGVDIFFVISGYLMTKIIVESLQNNTFSVWDFYSKRVKRIVPPLLFLVLAATVVGFFVYLPSQYKENETNAFSSLLFFSNILYWKHTSYFASAADNNLFLHTWSLSAEWQFYLTYPLIISLFSKLSNNKRKLTVVFISACFIFTLMSIVITNKSPVASFFLLPTRAWELMTGGLAFIFAGKIRSRILLIASYLIIFLSIIFFNEQLLWPGVFTLIPVIATFLIIIINHNNHLLFRNKPVQLIGKTSYSIYLWHWPIIVFARYLGCNLTFSVNLIIIISSLVIAFLSFTYIESIKFKKAYGIIGITACLAALTLLLANNDFNSWLFKRKTLEIADYTETHQKEINKDFSLNYCFIVKPGSKIEDLLKRNCLTIDTNKQNILLIGDSHAACLANSFRQALKPLNINLITTTASQGFPLITEFINYEYPTKLYRYIYFDYLVKNRRHINKIILAGNWFTGSKEIVNELLKTVAYIKKLNIPVVIIGQDNVFTIPYPSIIAKWNENGVDNINLYINKDAEVLNRLFKAKLNPYYIDVYYYSNIPRLNNDGEPFMIDGDHYSKFGSDLVVKKIFNDTLFKKQILDK